MNELLSMINENYPLVTVGILSYNSSATIIETLNSVGSQTYKRIEIVVCDDGSVDNTIDLVNSWIEYNSFLFERIEVLTVDKNTGTPANCNRLLKAAKGKWLKMIAADDVLLPSCIEDFVTYVCHNPNVNVVYSNYNSFIVDNDAEIKITGPKITKEISQLFDTDAHKQLYIYIEHGFNISPAVFMRTEFARSIGFIEKYKVFEDTPFYVRVLKGGTKIYHLGKDTVLYRNDGDSVTREKDRVHFYKKEFIDNNLLFRKEYIYPLYPWYRFLFWLDEYSYRLQYYFTVKVLKNKRSRINNIIYYGFKAVNPYYLIKFIYKRICL